MMQPGMSYNSGSYRYGFNGKENDNEVEGKDDVVNLGERIYDSRIGRFLSIDPEIHEYPSLTSYSLAADNPIGAIDENGEKPRPITSTEFTKLVAKLGVVGNKRVGELFERIAIKSAQSSHPVYNNTSINYKSPYRAQRNQFNGGPKDVRPDGINAEIQGHTDYLPETDLGDSWYEAKVTGSTLTMNYRQGQISGMIDALGERIIKRQNPVEHATLTLFTTSDTKIDETLKDFAAWNGVSLFQSVAAIDENGNIVFSDPQLVNLDALNNVRNVLAPPGNNSANQRYSSFQPIDPKTQTKDIDVSIMKKTLSKDPDPNTAQDQ